VSIVLAGALSATFVLIIIKVTDKLASKRCESTISKESARGKRAANYFLSNTPLTLTELKDCLKDIECCLDMDDSSTGKAYSREFKKVIQDYIASKENNHG